ncbi:MAG: hypothetical protein FJ102_03805 [Deltaproteobacteria bacterium]|nr:hypothetical protein [Deltaproteobacteria bacterium]
MALAAGIVLLALGCLAPACGGKSVVVTAPPPTPEQVAALPPPVATSRFQLGINEALAVPSKFREQGDLPRVEAALAADMVSVEWLGADLVRGHTGNFPAISCSDLSRQPGAIADADAWVRAAAGKVQLVGMVSPWPGNQTGNYTERYLPFDLVAYEACVRGIVERYDGDGIDDMPGLPAPVWLWEVDNEPDLKNTNTARGATRDYDPRQFARPGEYATVLIASARAIREANPSARVLGLGLYRPHAANGRGYMREVLATPGAADAIDIVSLHTYADDDGTLLASGIAAARVELPGKPIWVTETNADDRGGAEEQARRLVAIVARSAAAGASAVFWHTLADPPSRPDPSAPGGMPGTALFRSVPRGGAEPKPVAEVFRRLAEKLRADDLVGASMLGDGAVKLKSGAVLLFSGSAPVAGSATHLLSGQRFEAGSIVVAPAWIEPDSG